jgi:formylglycine-generating enzyme required for sulfatase activity
MIMKVYIFPVMILTLLLTGCDNKDKFIQQTMDNMVYVQGGSYEMGDFCPATTGYSCALSKSYPVHKVTLDSFYISKYKITYKDFDFYTSDKKIDKLKVDPILLKLHPELRNPMRPAVANWELSRDYCQWLGNKTGLSIELPTEAQWEYVARNRGQNVLYATDDGTFTLDVNVPSENTIEKDVGISAPYLIGKYRPSPLGIYDMGTDSPEWVYDWFQKDWYKNSPENNPIGPENGTLKVFRGIPVGDSRDSDSSHVTAVTTFRGGLDPLLRSPVPPDDMIKKYNGNYQLAKKAYEKIKENYYDVAAKGFDPEITFRCVINESSIPDKYHVNK